MNVPLNTTNIGLDGAKSGDLCQFYDWFILFSVRSIYLSSISNPIHSLLRFFATIAVVPEPMKGSRTKSPSCVVKFDAVLN